MEKKIRMLTKNYLEYLFDRKITLKLNCVSGRYGNHFIGKPLKVNKEIFLMYTIIKPAIFHSIPPRSDNKTIMIT